MSRKTKNNIMSTIGWIGLIAGVIGILLLVYKVIIL